MTGRQIRSFQKQFEKAKQELKESEAILKQDKESSLHLHQLTVKRLTISRQSLTEIQSLLENKEDEINQTRTYRMTIEELLIENDELLMRLNSNIALTNFCIDNVEKEKEKERERMEKGKRTRKDGKGKRTRKDG